MPTPLFQSLLNPVGFDVQKGIFYRYKKGWLLALRDLKAETKVYESTVFINSMLIGKFVYSGEELVGYYFTSQFKSICNGACLLAYAGSKAGLAKECNRVYSDESLVIIEYAGCGTLAISPVCNYSIQTILEEQ